MDVSIVLTEEWVDKQLIWETGRTEKNDSASVNSPSSSSPSTQSENNTAEGSGEGSAEGSAEGSNTENKKETVF